MIQIQQKQVMYNCQNPQHNNSQIEKMCINESCKSCKLLCDKCLQQDLHFGHYKDLIKITELPDFLKQKQKDCNDLINYLQQQMNNVQNQLSKLKQGIRQKYELDVGRLELINVSQIVQAIGEMIKFKDFKNLICQEISGGFQNMNQMIENQYQQLQLDNIKYKDISKPDKDKAKELYDEGYKLWDNDKYEDAIKKLDQSLSLNPYDHQPLWCKGECLRMLDKYNDAIPWFDKALDVDPKHVNSLWTKGDCLRMLSKYNDAIPWFDKALDIDPKHVNSLWNKGECLKMLAKYNDAIPWFDKALDIDPKHVLSLSSKGECLRMLDKYNDAIPYVEQALSINPNHENSISTKAQCLKGLGKYKEALEWFNKALQIDPDWTAYKNGKNFCQEKLGIK